MREAIGLVAVCVLLAGCGTTTDTLHAGLTRDGARAASIAIAAFVREPAHGIPARALGETTVEARTTVDGAEYWQATAVDGRGRPLVCARLTGGFDASLTVRRCDDAGEAEEPVPTVEETAPAQ